MHVHLYFRAVMHTLPRLTQHSIGLGGTGGTKSGKYSTVAIEQLKKGALRRKKKMQVILINNYLIPYLSRVPLK